jgi:hypothetical protein
LTRFLEHFTAAQLVFNKWGHIDRISNYPAGFALFVDIDSHTSTKLRIPKINSLFRSAGIQSGYSNVRYSRTKRGWHIVFLLDEKLTPVERVALESILGDDRMRASMNFARARNQSKMPKYWKQRWNILYDYKLENKK